MLRFFQRNTYTALGDSEQAKVCSFRDQSLSPDTESLCEDHDDDGVGTTTTQTINWSSNMNILLLAFSITAFASSALVATMMQQRLDSACLAVLEPWSKHQTSRMILEWRI